MKQQEGSPRKEEKMMQPGEVAKAILKAVIKRKNTLAITFIGKLALWVNEIVPRLTDKTIYNIMAKEPGSPFK